MVIAVVSASIALNLYTFALAYPQISVLNSGCCASEILAKDFSAYYTAAWRIIHDPANVYTPGQVSDGGPQILPHPESFKYLPSFLIFIIPLMAFSYRSALVTFDVLQLLLLPVMAYFLYRLNMHKNLLAISVLVVVAILQPSPTPHWGLSASYFWQWEEGQDKVLLLALLLCSYYFGARRKPVLSGLTLALASFDPRFFLLGLPLFLFYNRSFLTKSIASLAIAAIALGSLLLIPGVGEGFVRMVTGSGLETPLFYYGYIPLLTIIALIIANWSDVYHFYSTLLHGNKSILSQTS